MITQLAFLLQHPAQAFPTSMLFIREVLREVPLAKAEDQLVVGIDLRQKVSATDLYLIRERDATKINSHADLKGKVMVTSKKSALSIARLICSPVSVGVFSPPWASEVVERERVDGAYVFGIDWLRDRLKNSSNGGYGTIGGRLFRRLGFRAPEVSKVAGGYNIKRFLVLLPDDRPGVPENRYEVCRVEEFVGASGDYHLLSSSPFSYQLPDDAYLAWGFFGRSGLFRNGCIGW